MAQILSKWDDDRDGKITLSEFAKGMNVQAQRAPDA